MSLRVISSHLLVESPLEENDADFQQALEQILSSIFPASPHWWGQFTGGRRFVMQEKAYREFVCLAGSTVIQLVMKAQRSKGIERGIILPSSLANKEEWLLIENSQETQISPDTLILKL